MMTRFALAVLSAVLLDCGSASAQIGGTSISPGPPLGMTSPLGLGPASPVAPTRIPMGATELASPGVSPFMSATSPMTPATSVGATCGASSAASGTATAVFDGGGMSGTASGTCAAGGGSSAGPAPVTSSGTGMGSAPSVGGVGIPLGSTEIAVGGLSPPLGSPTTNPLAPLTSLTPLIAIPPSNSSAPASTSTAPCQTTATGVPIEGQRLTTANAFGAPLTGSALGSAVTRCDSAP
jgi:hypothetical protein